MFRLFRKRPVSESKRAGRPFRALLAAVMTGLALVGPGIVSEKLAPAAQAANSGVRYYSTYSAARSFANSISRSYHTKITKSGKQYRVDYWKKGSHG